MALQQMLSNPNRQTATNNQFYNSGLANVLGGITNTLTKYPRDLGQMIREIGLASKVKRVEAPNFTTQQLSQMGSSKNFNAQPQVQVAKAQGAKSATANKNLQSEIANPTFISKKERETLYDYSTAVKDSAIMASMIVPGVGSGLSGALATGAIAGGLGGYGTSEKGQEVAGTLKGAALGGAAGGVGYGIGAAIKGIGKGIANKTVAAEKEASSAVSKMSKLEKNSLAGQVQNSGMWQAGKSTDWNIQNFQKFRELTGLKNGSPQQVIDRLSEIGDNFMTTKETGLKNINLTPNAGDEITGGLYGKLGKEVKANKLVNSQTYQSVAEDINRAVQSGDASALDDLAIKLRDSVNYRLSTTGNVQPITSTEQKIYDNAADSIVEYLKKASNQTDGLYTQGKEGLSSVLRMSGAKELTNAVRANNKGLTMFGVNAPSNVLPVNPIIGGASRTLGRAGEVVGKVPTAIGNLGSTIGEKLGTANTGALGEAVGSAAPIGSAIQRGAGLAGMLGNAEMPQQQEQTQTPEGIIAPEGFTIDPVTGYLKTPSMADSTTAGGTAQGVDFVTALAQAQELLPGGSASELLAYAKAIMDASAPATSNSQSAGKINAVISSVNQAESLLNAGAKPGLAKGLLTKIGNITGTASDLDTQYQSAIAGVNTTIATLLTGTAQTESETRKLQNMIISGSDSEKAVRSKLEQIRSYVAAYAGQ